MDSNDSGYGGYVRNRNSAQSEYQKKEAEKMKSLQADYDSLVAQTSQKGVLRENNQGFNTVSGGMNSMDQVRPDYMSMINSEGQLDDRFKQTLGTSYTALRDKAMAEGDTDATSLMRQQLGNQITDQRGQIASDLAGSVANARAGMAMRGGLRSGQAERLGQAGVRQGMFGNQQLGRQGIDQNLNLSINNENMKNQMLGQVGGVEQTINAANIGTFANDVQNQNTFFGNIYKEDVAAEAANRTADAQRKASKSTGCF